MPRRIILIHGRSTKPPKPDKERFAREALVHGLARENEEVAAEVDSGRLPFELAYYGDVNNAILWARERGRKLEPEFWDRWNVPAEDPARYEAPLQRLLSRSRREQSRRGYEALYEDSGDGPLSRYIDDIADVVAPIAEFLGFNDALINRALPDLAAYLTSRIVGSEVRSRLQSLLVPALDGGDDVCLIAHSMGTMVAWDVLWKLSRMSEYRHVRERRVSLFLTLGAPLGEPAVRKQLYDADEPEDGRYPANIEHWHNFTARDDFVAHDEEIADDFEEMKARRLVRTLKDHLIYTLWCDDKGVNPHKLYGYLDNHQVARRIVAWARA